MDDDRAAQSAAIAGLAHRDYEVTIVADGDTALRMIDLWEPHLVVMELMLPRVSGAMVLASLRQRAASHIGPTVLLTSTAPFAAEVGALFDVDELLPKPFTPATLRAAVERRLAR